MFNYIDFLSPPITLFHLEKRTHTSKIGGFLVIVLVTICVGYISYLLSYSLSYNRVTSTFFKKFEFEVGRYSFDSSSIFHFIQIFSPECGGYFDKYDTRYIRAFTTYVHSNFKDADLELYDHWVFDTCRKDIDDKGLDPSLFENVDNFTNAVCIRHFYNSTEKKYYSLGEEGFSWPYLEHGVAQKNNLYLMTIIQKCTNDTIINKLFGNCPSQMEIDEYLSQYWATYLYFTDIQVDPFNYTNPAQKYLNAISSGIGTSQTYVENYIHYSPVKVKTRKGNIFSNSNELNTFFLDFNRKGSANNNPKYFTITKYYHLMQNTVQIYERKYNNLFDFFSEIGGVVQMLFYIFFWVNYAYNKYIIAYDTNSLFFAVKDNETQKIEIKTETNKNFSTSNDNDNDINNNLNKINIFMNNNNNNNDIIISGNLKKPLQKFISLQGLNKQKRALLKSNNNNNNNNNINNNINNTKSKLFQKEEISFAKNINQRRRSDNINQDNIKKKYYYLSAIKFSKDINKNAFRSKDQSSPNDLNCSNLKLRESNNLIFNKDIHLKPFNSSHINKTNSNKLLKTLNYGINPERYYNKICMSKNSLAKIDHKGLKSKRIHSIEKLKSVKKLSFVAFVKSLCFDKNGSIQFVSKFRKHLLSEEHLFKNHIKTVLLEKQVNNKNADNTNVFECFNEL